VPAAGDLDPDGEGEEEETAYSVTNARTPDPALAKLELVDLPVPKIPSGVCSPEPEVLTAAVARQRTPVAVRVHIFYGTLRELCS
jgi:hypothetical protein